MKRLGKSRGTISRPGLLDLISRVALKESVKRRAPMAENKDIREKLEKLEALFARGATAGERAAAGTARDRLQAKLALAAEAGDEPETETELC